MCKERRGERRTESARVIERGACGGERGCTELRNSEEHLAYTNYGKPSVRVGEGEEQSAKQVEFAVCIIIALYCIWSTFSFLFFFFSVCLFVWLVLNVICAALIFQLGFLLRLQLLLLLLLFYRQSQGETRSNLVTPVLEPHVKLTWMTNFMARRVVVGFSCIFFVVFFFFQFVSRFSALFNCAWEIVCSLHKSNLCEIAKLHLFFSFSAH